MVLHINTQTAAASRSIIFLLHAVRTVDSASDISGISPRPVLAPPVRARPTVRAPLLRLFWHLRDRGVAAATAAATACPLSSRRTLPHDAQVAKSPSARRRRTAPQWAHQHIAEGAIATTPAGGTSLVAGRIYSPPGRYIFLEGFRAFARRSDGLLASLLHHLCLFFWWTSSVECAFPIPCSLYIYIWFTGESAPRRFGNRPSQARKLDGPGCRFLDCQGCCVSRREHGVYNSIEDSRRFIINKSKQR